MKDYSVIRPVIAWFGLLILAFVNGAIREIAMKQLLGLQEPFAHQLSCLTGVLLWTTFVVLIWSELNIRSPRQCLMVGIAWLTCTFLFETFVLNRNLTWSEIGQTYNVLDGELWGLVLLYTGALPYVVYVAKQGRAARSI